MYAECGCESGLYGLCHRLWRRLRGGDPSAGGHDISNVDLMASLTPDSMPSMAQDRVNRKKSEVEIFAGTVRRLAERQGIMVPTNDYLYRRIMEIEAES